MSISKITFFPTKLRQFRVAYMSHQPKPIDTLYKAVQQNSFSVCIEFFTSGLTARVCPARVELMDKFVRIKREEVSEEQHTGHTAEPIQRKISWKLIKGENLQCKYGMLYSKRDADALLKQCEEQLEYNVGDLATVRMFAKRIPIPRKHVAYGDPGVTYTFSGVTLPARVWTPLLQDVRETITREVGHSFNFVLINRYKDGSDYIGEHRDNESDLQPGSPIASLSLGQARDFIFKHKDARGKHAIRRLDPVKLELQHGSVLVMCDPTNQYWYHSLPVRKKAIGVRINMTFRDMVVKETCKV